jgi:hypothetical protein
MYANDRNWWNEHHARVHDGWTANAATATRYGLNHVPCNPGTGFSSREGWITRNGRNSGDHAIQLARHLGYKRVLLVGYDAQDTNGRGHFHRDHPLGVDGKRNHRRWIAGFEQLARTADIEIINCTLSTALTCFTRQPLEAAL